MNYLKWICLGAFLLFISCGEDEPENNKEVIPSVTVTIDSGITYQAISGFGGANTIWGTDYLSSSEMDLAFGTGEDELGLSIFRVRLPSSESDWAGLLNSIKQANERNVKVLASPWSPPAKWKSNNSVNGGGYLLEEHYADFADYINSFIQYMADRGAIVDVVSVQNEPDYQVSYEGCEYSTTEMLNFVKNYAGVITGAKLLAAESFNFKQTYTNLILNDSEAVNNISIVGGHLYGSGLASYSLAEQKGKEIWMTEHLLNLNSGENSNNWTEDTPAETIWEETMDMVQEIHASMSRNWNAYIWWYIRRYYSFLGDGEKGTTQGQILKRGYAMSQFSKFIRPGYVRIGYETKGAALDDMKLTAYLGDNKMVVVIINPTKRKISEVELNAQSAIMSAVKYTTSLTENREMETLIPQNSSVSIDLEVNSITTVVIGY
ncbi:MAG: cellulose-binding protein [Labilibaculum sp.]|nr:cellulose-binding protein [Labilibaculum sp.]